MFKLFIILIIIFLLRLPSLFEPNWYGDEGIYLAIGQAINRGSVLYRDIWDNKTPILYLIYAIFPVLWWAKLAAMGAVLGTCVGAYKISKSLVATLLVGVLLAIPRFEGTIANAELFFVLPIVWAAYFALRGERFFWIGLLGAVAFLIKVPAVFDFIGILIFLAAVKKLNFKILIGFGVPIVITCLYFLFNNALGDFLTSAFLTNATYVSVESGPLSQVSNPLFIKGFILGLGTLGLVVCYLKKLISRELLLFALWFGFSLFGALLSNRPYLHYLLQIIPPTIILIVYLIYNFRKYWVVLVLVIATLLTVEGQFLKAFRLQTVPYYRNFIDYSLGNKTWNDYVNFFDRNTLKTYEIAEFVKSNTSPGDLIFVWDDAANIYVLSERKPATKYIQAHHLTLVSLNNYEKVIEEIDIKRPKLILVDENSRFKFDKLKQLIKKSYKFDSELYGLKIYKIKL